MREGRREGKGREESGEKYVAQKKKNNEKYGHRVGPCY